METAESAASECVEMSIFRPMRPPTRGRAVRGGSVSSISAIDPLLCLSLDGRESKSSSVRV